MREIVGHFAGGYPGTGSPCSGSAAKHQGQLNAPGAAGFCHRMGDYFVWRLTAGMSFRVHRRSIHLRHYFRRNSEVNLIAHVEIPALDLERAMRFYTAVFDVSFEEIVTIHDNRMAYFPFEEGKDGASGALAEGDTYVPTKDGAIIYLSVETIDDVLARAVQHGSEILFPKTPVNENLFVAEISDSEGNRIAIQSA